MPGQWTQTKHSVRNTKTKGTSMRGTFLRILCIVLGRLL